MVATNDSMPARIRNTAVGIDSYASLISMPAEDATLSRNVQTCAMDPCSALGTTTSSAAASLPPSERAMSSSSEVDGSGSGRVFEGAEGDFTDQSCVDGNLGVYCPCFQATITGEQVGGWV